MTFSPVAVDLNKTLDIKLSRSANVAFNGIFFVNDISEFTDVIFRQIFNSDVGIYACFRNDLLSLGTADAVNVGKSYLLAFVSR